MIFWFVFSWFVSLLVDSSFSSLYYPFVSLLADPVKMAEENPKVEENAEPKSPVQEEKPQEKDQTFHSEWTFWFDQSKSSKKPEKEDSFEETVVKLGTFNDIKGFWRFISLFTFSCRILTLTQFLAVSTPTLQSQIPCRPVQT
jgi:hypothetical protein